VTAEDEPLDMAAVARLLGLTSQTVRKYRSEGRMPEPDWMIGRSPAWRRSTIEGWQNTRPGRGHYSRHPRGRYRRRQAT
jgi:predicted DNA-binding transcriptional regulator AlpA